MEQVDLKGDLLKIVHGNVNVPGLFNGLVDGVAEPALRAAIAKSESKIDDILVAALYQPLEDEIKKLVKEKWDSLLAAQSDDGDPV